jgi:hypothetical protein
VPVHCPRRNRRLAERVEPVSYACARPGRDAWLGCVPLFVAFGIQAGQALLEFADEPRRHRVS